MDALTPTGLDLAIERIAEALECIARALEEPATLDRPTLAPSLDIRPSPTVPCRGAATEWLDRVLTAQLPSYAGELRSVREWLAAASTLEVADELRAEPTRVLGDAGIAMVRPKARPRGWRPTHFAIANAGQGALRFHAGSRWDSLPGAPGLWIAAARALPGARAGGHLRFSGEHHRCTLIPLALAFPESAAPTPAALS